MLKHATHATPPIKPTLLKKKTRQYMAKVAEVAEKSLEGNFSTVLFLQANTYGSYDLETRNRAVNMVERKFPDIAGIDFCGSRVIFTHRNKDKKFTVDELMRIREACGSTCNGEPIRFYLVDDPGWGIEFAEGYLEKIEAAQSYCT
jgi:hypothetical protein